MDRLGSLLVLSLPLAFALTACGSSLNPFHHKAGDIADNRTPGNKGQDACADPSVKTIKRPYYPERTSSKTFAYSYEMHPASPGFPTVVYIPGGPGQTSIGESSDWLSADKLPAGFGLMLTDPRGVGCNNDGVEEYPASFYSSQNVAGDVLAAVAKEGLKDWLVYGISYGTVVATITASKAEAGVDAAVPPKAVVLEGTLGRAMHAHEDTDTYVSLWNTEMAAHPGTQAAFSQTTLPLGYHTDQWNDVIQIGLMLGNVDATIAGTKGAFDFLGLLIEGATSSDSERQAWAKKTIDSLLGNPSMDTSVPGMKPFYFYVACQEIWPDVSGWSLQDGQLVVAEDASNPCAKLGLSLTGNAFDAKQWPIKAPIYYLQGQADPATPVALARYHFTSEPTSKDRKLILVGGGGHNDFEYSLTSCYQPVWRAMAAGTGVEAAVQSCQWPLGVTLGVDNAGDGTETDAELTPVTGASEPTSDPGGTAGSGAAVATNL
jgi:proline iminopeptidase